MKETYVRVVLGRIVFMKEAEYDVMVRKLVSENNQQAIHRKYFSLLIHLILCDEVLSMVWLGMSRGEFLLRYRGGASTITFRDVSTVTRCSIIPRNTIMR